MLVSASRVLSLASLLVLACGADASPTQNPLTDLASETGTGTSTSTSVADTDDTTTKLPTTDGPATTDVPATTSTTGPDDPTAPLPPMTSDGTTVEGDPTSAEATMPNDDPDRDGVPDANDNCPDDWNPMQIDTDGDGYGNSCDVDDDNDGILDPQDDCPLGDICNDADGDGALDDDDVCPDVPDPDQINTDGDYFGDACDDDDDNDNDLDDEDNCPLIKNGGQEDLDGDGTGDACDDDADGDGFSKTIDPSDKNPACPGEPLPNSVYVSTWETIYAVDVDTYALTKLATAPLDMVGFYDLAFDANGFLYGLFHHNGFEGWLKCISRTTGTAYSLVTTEGNPTNYDGLAGFPPGVLDPDGRYFAVIRSTSVIHGHVENYTFVEEPAGYLDPGHYSRGDLAHLPGLGTYAAVVHKDKNTLVKIVMLDPLTGQFLDTIVTLTGYSAEFALAGVDDRLLAFGIGGEILEIDPIAKTVDPIVDTNLKFYGAASPFGL